MDEIETPETDEPGPGGSGPASGRPDEAGKEEGVPGGGAEEEDTLLRESPDPPITE
jgi:hypothetical protein